MSLYAIGDLHLHFEAELKNKAQLTDPLWRDHERRLLENCRRLIRPEDTLVLVGDHSWGRKMAECQQDFDYIRALPGRKILLRGNHDMFWDVNKTAALNDQFKGELFFLQNNYAACGDIALVGTKGYTFEGPFYLNRRGQVVGWDEDAEEQAAKLVEREAARLRLSCEAARKDGYRRFILFLHYPPTNDKHQVSGFTELMTEYGVKTCVYGHLHGKEKFKRGLQGVLNGVEYKLVSLDYLDARPMRLK